MAEGPKHYGPLLRQVAADHASTELAVFEIAGDRENFDLVYYVCGPGEADKEAHKRQVIPAFVRMIRKSLAAKSDGAFRIAEDRELEHPQYCLVTLAQRSGKIVGAAGFIVRCYHEKDARNLLRCIQQQAERFRKGPPQLNA